MTIVRLARLPRSCVTCCRACHTCILDLVRQIECRDVLDDACRLVKSLDSQRAGKLEPMTMINPEIADQYS
jgi:hypothetical protein